MKTTDKTVLSVANDLIENGVDLNGYELIVTIEKQPLNEYLHKEYEETKKRLIAIKNALNDIDVDIYLMDKKGNKYGYEENGKMKPIPIKEWKR